MCGLCPCITLVVAAASTTLPESCRIHERHQERHERGREPKGRDAETSSPSPPSLELAIVPINGTEPAVLTAGFLGSLLSAVLPGTLGALNEALASTFDAAHEACAAPRVGVPPAAATTTTGTGMSGLETLLSCTVYGAAYGISALVIGGHLACPRFCCVPRRGAAADGGAFPIASHYPRSLTWPLSLLLVLNLLLFSYANAPVLDGAMVRATVSVAGAPLPPLDVFGIGLPSSVTRLWWTVCVAA